MQYTKRFLILALLLGALGPVQSWAAAAFDSVGTGAAIGVTTVSTAAFTIAGSNRAGAIHLAMQSNNKTGITCSLGGVSGTLVPGTDSTTTTTLRTMIFSVIAPPTGRQTATCSWTGSDTAAIGAITATTVDQTTPMNHGSFTTSIGVGTNTAIVASNSGDLTTSVQFKDGSGPSVSTNQNAKWTWGTNAGGDVGAGVANTVHTWTGNGIDTMLMSVANFVQLGGGSSCTTTTANLTQATIQTAIDAANAGDTICLPAGTQTWTTTSGFTPSVALNKGVTLLGTTSCTGTPVTCVDGTVINDGTTANAAEDMLYMSGTNARVSGISFKDPRTLFDSGPAVRMRCANCRFDHNSVTQTNGVAPTHGVFTFSSTTSTQLLDHNYFKDLNGATDVDGSLASEGTAPIYRGTASWEATLTPGSANATYLEDNNYDFTAGTVLDGAYDAYNGARLVFRYNTVKSTNMGGHGFDSDGRSTVLQEIYRNTITNLGSAWYSWFQTRGGLHHLFENTISASGGSYNGFLVITNYRSDGTACDVCGDKGLCDGSNVRDQNTGGQQGYACRDQVGRGTATDPTHDWPTVTGSPVFSQPLTPAYSWGNTFKGAAPTIADVTVISGASGLNWTRMQTYHMLNNRDFYVEVPGFTGATGTGTGTLASIPATCTVGVAYWATDQGSWNRLGTDGVLYKCTSLNTWTVYYTPYIYPHPLQQLTAVPIDGPRFTPSFNLRR